MFRMTEQCTASIFFITELLALERTTLLLYSDGDAARSATLSQAIKQQDRQCT